MLEINTDPEEVVAFWIGAGPEKWYSKDAAFDQEISDRFGATWLAAQQGAIDGWPVNARGALAAIILLDQFPRNMFRDDPRAFATDEMGKKLACRAIDRGFDLKIAEPERQFVYMPFMHSERLSDQDHCVRLMKERMTTSDNLLHARVHREIIRKFNRFPYRNAALGRNTTAAEQAFLDQGGYAALLQQLQAAGG